MRCIARLIYLVCVSALALCVTLPQIALAQGVGLVEAPAIGPETGLKLPRFVSIEEEGARMRLQPSTDHTILYIYLRVGLPMRVLNEEGEWRYVEDHDGKQGWMHRSVLSGQRTFRVMMPTTPLYTRANANAPIRAEMEAGVVGNLLTCRGDGWCRAQVESPAGRQTGWLRTTAIWGVLPGEGF